MIRSMTAFASAERATAWGTLSAEMRAVNHRYLEFSLRAPDDLRGLEPVIRERVAGKVQRGKVEMSLRLKSAASDSSRELVLNANCSSAWRRSRHSRLAVSRICKSTSPNCWPAWRGGTGHPDPAGLQAETLALIDTTIVLPAAREREGAKLAAVLREKLDGIETACAQVRQWLPEIRAGLRTRLETRFAELAPTLEPGRLEQEFVLWLQKLDVDEELDRLATHIAEARRVLGLREAVGRRLDFLMQEFNREANTLGSKSVDARTSQIAVELKVLIEQMREQVQNLE